MTSPGLAPPRQDDYRPSPDRWMALAVCLAAGFMTLLDVSIVNVALPSIEQGLHAQQNELEWIVAGYALSLGLLLVPAGRFGDAHGRRPVFERDGDERGDADDASAERRRVVAVR